MQIQESNKSGSLLDRLVPRASNIQSDLDGGRQDATAGQYLVHMKDGKAWPIVICDEEMASNFNTPRPNDARRPDGTWHPAVLPGGSHAGAKVYPCVYVGTLKRVWIPIQKLDAFEKFSSYQKERDSSNPDLANAWKEARERYDICRGTNDLGYWKDQILAKKIQEDFDTDLQGRTNHILDPKARKSTEKRKRKQGLTAREDIQDDDEPDSFLDPKTKKECGEEDEYNPFIDGFTRPSSSNSTKRGKLSVGGLPTPRLGTPFTYISPPASTLSGRRRRIHKSPARSLLHKTEDDPEGVKIYVSDVVIRITRSKLSASPKLQDLLHRDSESGWFVMSPLLSSMTKVEFEPIAHFLQRQEYSPNLLDDGTDYVRLERPFTSEELGQEIERSGMIHSNAQQFKIEALQNLSFRKLKVLATSDEPFPLISILNVIQEVFEVASAELRQFLIQYLAQSFWEFVDLETQKTKEVMQQMKTLAKGVHAILAGQAPGEVTGRDEDGSAKSEDTAMENPPKEKGGEVVMGEAEKKILQENEKDFVAAAVSEAEKCDLQKAEDDIMVEVMKASMLNQADNFFEEYI